MKYYCDTNFIIRYLIADNDLMFEESKEIFNQAKNGKLTLIIEQAVFTEVVFVLSSFYKVPKTKIYETLSELLIYKGIEVSSKECLILALNLYAVHNLHIVDCIIIANAKFNNIDIKSFDQKLLNLFNSNEE